MAAGDITFYAKYIKAAQDQSTLSSMPVDFDTDTLKVIVLTRTHSVDTSETSTDEHLDDISADEVSTGTAYTGPITLTTVAVAFNGLTTEVSADDVTIDQDVGGGFTDARFAVIYKDSGVAATSPLIVSIDLGEDRDNTLGDLIFQWGAGSGIVFTVT